MTHCEVIKQSTDSYLELTCKSMLSDKDLKMTIIVMLNDPEEKIDNMYEQIGDFITEMETMRV